MELQKALSIAEALTNHLAGQCDIINIAGSCRRMKPDVKDIEIVALPKRYGGNDLFGGDLQKVPSDIWINKVYALGEAVKGKPSGKYMQIMLQQKINLDLFMPDDFDYYRQFAIRTGSSEWTQRFIAGGWVKLGWVGSDRGLRLRNQCIGEKGPDNKMKWKFNSEYLPIEMKPPHWKSEEDFFAWLGLKWVHPKLREI